MKIRERNRNRIQLELVGDEIGHLLVICLLAEAQAGGDTTTSLYQIWDGIKRTPSGARIAGEIKSKLGREI